MTWFLYVGKEMMEKRLNEFIYKAIESNELIMHVITGKILLDFRKVCIGYHREKGEGIERFFYLTLFCI